MNKAKELLDTIGETKQISFDKVDLSQWSTNAANAIRAMQKLRLKGKIDDNGSGYVTIPGLGEVYIELGTENFYFSLPQVFVKGATDKALSQIIALGKLVSNYS